MEAQAGTGFPDLPGVTAVVVIIDDAEETCRRQPVGGFGEAGWIEFPEVVADREELVFFVPEETDMFGEVRIFTSEVDLSFDRRVDVQYSVSPRQLIGDIFGVAAKIDIPWLKAYDDKISVAYLRHGVRGANIFLRRPCRMANVKNNRGNMHIINYLHICLWETDAKKIGLCEKMRYL